MEEKMVAILVRPGEKPRVETMGSSIEAMEAKLGGEIKLGCFLPQRVMLISRSDTRGLAPNRMLPGGKERINGPFLLCGIPESGIRFASLSPAQREEFLHLFAQPGEFMAVRDEVYSDPDDVADAVYSLWESMGDGEMVVLTKMGGRKKEYGV